MLRSFWLAFVVFAFALGLVVGFAACKPGEGPEPGIVIKTTERAGCILLRALSDDDTVHDVCATADELAPLVEQIISEREARSSELQAPLTVAYAVPPPPRKVPRRRCASWVYLGGSDGSGNAGDSRASESSARRVDASEPSDRGRDR